MSLKIGIIGAGGMLQYHAPGFKAGGAEIVAICDMNQEAAKKQPRPMVPSMSLPTRKRCLMNCLTWTQSASLRLTVRTSL